MEENNSSDSTMKEVAQEAQTCLGWIFSGMGISAQIETLLRKGDIFLNVLCGDDSSIAIGRKGQTLEALQTLVNRISANRFAEVAKNEIRIYVDVEGYRERRRRNLVEMSRRVAEEVQETGELAYLEPLNSYERYLVHDALKDDPGVVTSSTGDGAMKQIVISPAREEQI